MTVAGLPIVPLLLSTAAVVFLAVGRRVRAPGPWGPAALVVLAACAAVEFCAGPPRPADVVPSNGAAHGTERADSYSERDPVEAGSTESDAAENRAPLVRRDRVARVLTWWAIGLGALLVLCGLEGQRAAESSAGTLGYLLASLSGLAWSAVADDVVLLFAAGELAAWPLVPLLVGLRDDATGREAAAKRGVLSAVAAWTTGLGLAAMAGLGGSTRLAEIAGRLSVPVSILDLQWGAAGPARAFGVVAVVALVAGCGARMMAVPFRSGASDACEGTTAWGAMIVSLVPVAAGTTLLLRTVVASLPGLEAVSQVALIVAAAGTLLAGGIGAAGQTNLRRLTASLVTVESGFVLTALAAGLWTDAAATGAGLARSTVPHGGALALRCLVVSGLMLAGLFALATYLARPERRVDFVEDLAGLARGEPWAALCGCVLLAGLAGAPPLAGFWCRLGTVGAALRVHREVQPDYLPEPHPGLVWLTLIGGVATVLVAATAARVIGTMLFDGQVARPRPTGGQPALAAALAACGLTIAIGVLPGAFLDLFDVPVAEVRRVVATSE